MAIDGSLRIVQYDLGGIFQPRFGDEFIVITAVGELAGEFDNIVAVNLNPILVYEVFYDYDTDIVTLCLDSFFSADFDVDGADFQSWQTGFGMETGATQNDGDADEDGDVDEFDLLVWKNEFGGSVGGPKGNRNLAAVPEPGAGILVLGLSGIFCLFRSIRFAKR